MPPSTPRPGPLGGSLLALYTEKTLDAVLATGGSQSWSLDRRRASACNYAVLFQNSPLTSFPGASPHGSAFMIGRVSSIAESTITPGRCLVRFDRYARINLIETWKWKSHVRFLSGSDLPDLDIGHIEFEDMPSEYGLNTGKSSDQLNVLLSAQRDIARVFKVDPGRVEIRIRGAGGEHAQPFAASTRQAGRKRVGD